MARKDSRRVGSPTERALARMLGGVPAGGRARVPDFLAEPEISAEAFTSTVGDAGVETATDVGVTLDTFHFLRRRLEVSPTLTAWLQREGREDAGDWWDSMRRWAKSRHVFSYEDGWNFGEFLTVNVDNFLSDDLEMVTFTYRDAPMVVIRSSESYRSRPYVFEVTADEPWDIADWDTWSFGHMHEWTEAQEPLPGVPALPRPQWHAWERERMPSDWWTTYDGGDTVKLDSYASHGHVSDAGGLQWRKDGQGLWRPVCPLDGALCDLRPPDTW
jgi:hypothetical protein